MTAPPPWFMKFILSLSERENFSQKLPLLIAATGKSREYVSRLFMSITGTTLLHYVQAKRVDHACRLLRSTEQEIIDISLERGFENLSTFYHVFKRYTGEAPKQYRERFRESEKHYSLEENA